MFKVGMGVTPTVPDTLSDEGHQFVDMCLQHNPNTRATALDLLEHNFIKVFINNLISCVFTKNILFAGRP